MAGVTYDDIVLACEESGADVVSRDDEGVTLRIPDLTEFAYSWGHANTEWVSEGSYFLGARRRVEGDLYRFDYPLMDE